jgi:peptide subunit release factor 1 (eRF1)
MKIANQTASCPSCKEKIYVGENPKVGKFIDCKFCDEQLEIVKVNPVILDWIYYPDSIFETYKGDQLDFE